MRLRSSAVCTAVVGALLLLGSLDVSARQRETRTIYVTALDDKGIPVSDLQAEELGVKVGNKQLEVTRVEPAQTPLRIAVIVSDAGTGGFQAGLAAFLQKLVGRAEFSLISVIVQPEVIVDYSGETAVLRDGLRRLGARGRQGGGQLMEAIYDASKNVRREGKRAAIVVMRVGSEATTVLSSNQVRDQLRKSGALLHVVSTLGAQRQQPSSMRTGISAEQAQMQDDETANSNLNLGQVLGDGSKESGGRHDQVISTTLIPAVERVADELLSQYAVTCALPDGVKQTDKMTVSVKRKGVKVQAPARLPTP